MEEQRLVLIAFAVHLHEATGKRKASSAEFPKGWESGFGMDVEEHNMSTQVNFLDGYISPDGEGESDERNKNES